MLNNFVYPDTSMENCSDQSQDIPCFYAKVDKTDAALYTFRVEV